MNEIPRGQHDDQEGKGNGDGQQKQPQNRRSSWRRGESEETARGGGLPERKTAAPGAERQKGLRGRDTLNLQLPLLGAGWHRL